MANLMKSDCLWCHETYIKARIGESHGCPAEKEAAPLEEVSSLANGEPSEGQVLTLGR
jgi:hypothetical protein